MRTHPVLSEEETETVCARVEHEVKKLPRSLRIGFWERMKASHSALYHRFCACRCGRIHQMRRTDLTSLARRIGVESGTLLLPVGQRFRPSPPRIYHPDAAPHAKGMSSISPSIIEEADWLEKCRWVSGVAKIMGKLEVQCRPPSRTEQLDLAQRRARVLRDHLELGRGPLPSLTWILEIAGFVFYGVSGLNTPSGTKVFGATCSGRRVILRTTAYAALDGREKRVQLAEALWRVLLRDDTREGRAAKEAARAFLVVSPRRLPVQAALSTPALRLFIARHYGVPSSLIDERLEDWATLDRKRCVVRPSSGDERILFKDYPNPFLEQDERLSEMRERYQDILCE